MSAVMDMKPTGWNACLWERTGTPTAIPMLTQMATMMRGAMRMSIPSHASHPVQNGNAGAMGAVGHVLLGVKVTSDAMKEPDAANANLNAETESAGRMGAMGHAANALGERLASTDSANSYAAILGSPVAHATSPAALAYVMLTECVCPAARRANRAALPTTSACRRWTVVAVPA